MTLTLIDQLTLLALDDNKGVFIPDSTTFSYAIAGAVILELVLEEQIDISDDLVTVKPGARTDNPVLNQFLEMIRESKKQRKIKSWLEKIGQKGDEIKKETLAKLIDDGILVKKEEKILWVFQVDKFPTHNPRPENQLRGRLYDIVINHHKPDLKEVMILNLVESCRLEEEVFGKEKARVFKKEMERIKAEDHISGVVNKTVKEICEAVNALLVIMIATAVTTNVVTGR
jgi:hypothetical protein